MLESLISNVDITLETCFKVVLAQLVDEDQTFTIED
jgi:hypothetical protein